MNLKGHATSLGPAGGAHWRRDRFIDEIAVERATRGGLPLPKLTLMERLEATRIMESMDLVDKQRAERLGCSIRTLQRYRKELACSNG